MARVLKGFHSLTCTPTRSSAIGMSHTCLCRPSRSWYSFTDPRGMEGWVDLVLTKTVTQTPWWHITSIVYDLDGSLTRYTFLLCNSNFVSRYSTSKNVVTLKSGSEVTKCHWKLQHSIDCVLLVFLSNFVSKTKSFWDIQLQKCRDLENRVRGPSRSFEISNFDWAHTTSYWRSIITIPLSRVVSEIFNVEKCRDSEIGVRVHSRSLKVVSVDRSCMVSY